MATQAIDNTQRPSGARVCLWLHHVHGVPVVYGINDIAHDGMGWHRCLQSPVWAGKLVVIVE
jgi:hypothetical protein